jgi:Uncharacterized conserved protein
VLGLGIEDFAALAARALTPRTEDLVGVDHLHVPLVSVREQAAILVGRLRRQRVSTFRALIADCDSRMLIVGRFLALLEMFREALVAFEQMAPLGDLTIRWTGADEGEIDLHDEYDSADETAVNSGESSAEDETAGTVSGDLSVPAEIAQEDR